MKKVWILSLCVLMGCASAQIPSYLQDESPYVRRVFATFDESLTATMQALESLGWQVESQMHPAVFEQSSADIPEGDQILITTNVRQTALILGTRYARMNIILKSRNKETEIEIRYLTVNTFPPKTVRTYRNESAANRVFNKIESLMGKQ